MSYLSYIETFRLPPVPRFLSPSGVARIVFATTKELCGIVMESGMRRFYVASIAVGIVLVAARSAYAQERKSRIIQAGTAGAEMDKAVTSFDKEGGGFCGSVLVAVKGKVVLEKGYGLADQGEKKPIGPDSLWDWASVSKQFTAAAVLKLQDQKKLKLDDPLSKFFPDVPADKAKVKLRQLLNHTSGIEAGYGSGTQWSWDRNDRASFERMVLHLPMTSKPGEKFEYSNSAYTLSAAIVERVSGMTFEEFCIEHLFLPAGMKDASFIGRKGLDLSRVPKIDRGKGFPGERKEWAFAYGDEMRWMYRGCGGVIATTRDMFLWDRALRGDKIFSKAAKAELYKPALEDYALGWYVKKLNAGLLVEHGGGVEGVKTQYVRSLGEDIAVAIVCSYEPKENLRSLAETLLALARRVK